MNPNLTLPQFHINEAETVVCDVRYTTGIILSMFGLLLADWVQLNIELQVLYITLFVQYMSS